MLLRYFDAQSLDEVKNLYGTGSCLRGYFDMSNLSPKCRVFLLVRKTSCSNLLAILARALEIFDRIDCDRQ